MAGPVPYIFVPGTTIQSAQVNADFAAVIADINALPPPQSLVGFRNRIINGQMYIDQRNNGAAQNALDGSPKTYTVDRMWYGASAVGKFNSQRNAAAVALPSGASYYLGLTSTATTAVGASDFYILGQSIEGFNIQDFGFGTATATSISLSFYVRSSLTGVFAGAFRNNATNRSYVFTYTISLANTWEKIIVQNVPGDTTGTWLATNGIGLEVIFSLGVGSDFQTAPGTWATGNYLGTNTSINVVSISGATFYITSLQLEPGAVTTTFENRLYGFELEQCQRYCPVISGVGTSGTAIVGIGSATSANGGVLAYMFKIKTRVPPTGIVIVNLSSFELGGQTATAIAFQTASNDVLTMTANVAAGGFSAGNVIFMGVTNANALIIATGSEL